MILLTANPISAAIATIAGTVGHEVVVIADDDGGPGLDEAGAAAPATRWCCATTTPPTRRGCCASALASDGVVRRDDGQPAAGRGPAGRPRRPRACRGWPSCTCRPGHNLGGKGPGEIALSVVAEIVAEAHRTPRWPDARSVGAGAS